MDINQTRKILAKIKTIQDQIEDLEKVRFNLATNEYQSATISINGGSKSYTRADYSKIDDTILTLKKELKSYRRLLSGTGSNITSTTYIVYS